MADGIARDLSFGSVGEKFSSSITPDEKGISSNSDVDRHINQLGKKEKPESILERIEADAKYIRDLPKEEFNIQDLPDDDRSKFDWLLAKNGDVIIENGPKYKITAMVAKLSEDLSTSRNVNSAIIFNKEHGSGIAKTLLGILQSTSENHEDNLKYVQSEIRQLFRDALLDGKANINLSDADKMNVLNLFSSNPKHSLESLINLVSSNGGIDAILKNNSKFFNALNTSYNGLGKVLSSYVRSRISELATKPLSMITEEASNKLDSGLIDLVTRFKREAADTLFERIEESYEKQKDKILGGNPTDFMRSFLENLRTNITNMFTASDETVASEASQEFIKMVSQLSTASQASTAKEKLAKQTASKITTQLSQKKSAPISVPLSLLKDKMDKDNSFEEEVVSLVKGNFTDELARLRGISDFEANKNDVVEKLDYLIRQAGNSTVSYCGVNLNKEHLEKLLGSLDDSGSLVKENIEPKYRNTASNIIDSIRNEIKAQKQARVQAEIERIKEIVQQFGDKGTIKVEALISNASILTIPEVGSGSSEAVKNIVNRIKSALEEVVTSAKKETSTLGEFSKKMHRLVLKPILSQSRTIAMTSGIALLHSLADENGELKQDFALKAFSGLAEEAVADIRALKDSRQADKSILELSALQAISPILAAQLNELAIVDFKNIDETVTSNFISKNITRQTNITLSDEEKEDLMASTSNGTPFEQAQKKLKKLQLLTRVIYEAAKNASSSSSTETKQASKDLFDSLKFVLKEREHNIPSVLKTLKGRAEAFRKQLGEINAKYLSNLDSINKFIVRSDEVTAETVWDLKETFEGEEMPKDLQNILAELSKKMSQSLQSVFETLGLRYGDVADSIQDRILKIKENKDQGVSGILSDLKNIILNMSHAVSRSTSTPASAEPAERRMVA